MYDILSVVKPERACDFAPDTEAGVAIYRSRLKFIAGNSLLNKLVEADIVFQRSIGKKRKAGPDFARRRRSIDGDDAVAAQILRREAELGIF